MSLLRSNKTPIDIPLPSLYRYIFCLQTGTIPKRHTPTRRHPRPRTHVWTIWGRLQTDEELGIAYWQAAANLQGTWWGETENWQVRNDRSYKGIHPWIPAMRTSISCIMSAKMRRFRTLSLKVHERNWHCVILISFVCRLLYSVLPISVASELRHSRPVPAKKYDSVTLLFSGIVGFGAYCAAHTDSSGAMKIVNMLNQLYIAFDVLTDPKKNPNVYKVIITMANNTEERSACVQLSVITN